MAVTCDRSVLLTLCRCLSEDVAVRAQAVATLADATKRQAVLELAAAEGLLPALYEAAEQSPEYIPKPERIQLAIAHAAHRRRNRQIREAIVELAAEASKHSVEIVALKGGMWVAEDPDGFAAWRPMGDIDILVMPQSLAAMREVLAELNYRPARRESDAWGRRRFENHYHLVAYRRDNEPYFIEVHRHVGWRPDLLPTELAFEFGRKLGAGLAVPCPWHAALLSIIHWQIHHYGFQRGLSRILDGMEIMKWLHRPDVDWNALRERAAEFGIVREVDAAIALAVEMFGARAPAALSSSEQGRGYVERTLQIRESRVAAWQAKQHQRILRLWSDDRYLYRRKLRQTSPPLTRLGLWGLRVWRAPFVVSHGLSIGVLQLARWMRLALPPSKAK